MLAAYGGKMEPLQELRRLGATYELRDRTGATALHWACLSRNPPLVDWMVLDGADVSATDNLGRTPLMLLGMQTLFYLHLTWLLDYQNCSTSVQFHCLL